MFGAKYQGITWYCPTSGKYDAKNLIKVLYEYNNLIKKKKWTYP